MSETKKAAISLVVAALVFVLTAFSNAQSWEGAAEAAATQAATQTEENTSMETLEETQGVTVEDTEHIADETVEAESSTEKVETAPAESESESQEIESEETDPEESALEEGSSEDDFSETDPAETEAPVEETTQAPEVTVQAVDYFADQFMVTVTGKSALNVREEPNADSKWVGKMYEGSGGTILEVGDGWTKIQSGNVTGWVSNQYILTGEAGKAAALEVCQLVFEVTSDALKVRSAPTTDEDNKIRAIYGGDTYPVVTLQDDGWVEIEYKEGKTGWVAAQYGKIRYDYKTAMTRKEIQDAENAKKRKDVATTNRESTNASSDEVYLLACLINCESNHYEGQLAVANVVLNRVKSPKFPNSISDVIYSPGQFSPARSGKLERRLQSGPSASAMQAARDALNGVNNIGDYMFFRSAKTGDLSKYSAYTIVMGNCFYKK